MLTDPVVYRAAVAEALMHEFGHSWHDAFETAAGISPVYIVEGISPGVAALLWTEYTTARRVVTVTAANADRRLPRDLPLRY